MPQGLRGITAGFQLGDTLLQVVNLGGQLCFACTIINFLRWGSRGASSLPLFKTHWDESLSVATGRASGREAAVALMMRFFLLLKEGWHFYLHSGSGRMMGECLPRNGRILTLQVLLELFLLVNKPLHFKKLLLKILLADGGRAKLRLRRTGVHINKFN